MLSCIATGFDACSAQPPPNASPVLVTSGIVSLARGGGGWGIRTDGALVKLGAGGGSMRGLAPVKDCQ